jgi:hypothetical protein
VAETQFSGWGDVSPHPPGADSVTEDLAPHVLNEQETAARHLSVRGGRGYFCDGLMLPLSDSGVTRHDGIGLAFPGAKCGCGGQRTAVCLSPSASVRCRAVNSSRAPNPNEIFAFVATVVANAKNPA